MRFQSDRRPSARIRRSSSWSFLRNAAALAALCLAGAGCEGEQIHSYDAPKPPQPAAATGSPAAAPASAEPTRMLGAILPQGEQTWFFKLTGPPEQVLRLTEDFGKFVASTRFENGQPTWEIPPAWQAAPGSPMRFATYTIGNTGLEVSITTLGSQPDETAYLLSNVNRWRGQLGLADLTREQYVAREVPEGEEGEILTITAPAGQVVLINFVGKMAPSSSMSPPFAGMGAGGPPARPQPAARPGSPSFAAPDAWRPGAATAFSVASYEVGPEDAPGKVTVSSAGGDLLANINRWRNQVGLPPWSADELQQELKTLEAPAGKARYAPLLGDTQSILGAVLEHEGTTWFIKFMGPTETARDEQSRFEAFVQSMRFE